MLDSTKFDRLCEQAITNTTKMFYPRNLKFSDKFLAAFKEEYNNQKKMVIEDKGHKAFGNHFERMLKGLRFEAKKIDDENKPKSKQKPKLVEGRTIGATPAAGRMKAAARRASGSPFAKVVPTGKASVMSPAWSARHAKKVRRQMADIDAGVMIPKRIKREIDAYLEGDPNIHIDFWEEWINEFLSSVGFPEAEDFKDEIYDYLKRKGSLVFDAHNDS